MSAENEQIALKKLLNYNKWRIPNCTQKQTSNAIRKNIVVSEVLPLSFG